MDSSHHRWVAASGLHLLVVDPDVEQPDLRDALAGRGVHLTWVSSTTDALVEFGRTRPHAVVVALGAGGLATADFVAAIRRHGSTCVLVAGERVTDSVAGILMAGATAWAQRPYDVADLWEQLVSSPDNLKDHAHVSYGCLDLDAAAYRVSIDGRRIPDLPLKEFELLRALMLRAPGIVSDAELRVALWGSAASPGRRNSIATHVTRLRVRLGSAVVVRRVRGRGYALSTGD